MNSAWHILSLAILATFFSCGQPNENKNVVMVTNDTLQASVEKGEKERLERRKEMEEQDLLDSLVLDKVLKEALTIATRNIGKDKFQEEYVARPCDEYYIQVEIDLDNHFTKLYPHLIIRRYEVNEVHTDIYIKNGIDYERVLSHEQWTMEYVNDTIRDINGDGFSDFVVNWYGVSGCCLKAFSNIYLLRSDQKNFSENFEFINPTFSPNEHIIRGVCYGHPGETEMYKYKWNGEKVDTLEYISYEVDEKGVKTGRVVISTDRPYTKNFRILKTINSVPKEYSRIDGYDWFIGYDN